MRLVALINAQGHTVHQTSDIDWPMFRPPLAVLYRGKTFIRTGKKGADGFHIFAEGHRTIEHVGWGDESARVLRAVPAKPQEEKL